MLTAFLLGLALAKTFERHRVEQQRFRVVAFAFLTPFFFLKGGMNVSLTAVWANLGLVRAVPGDELLSEVRRRVPGGAPIAARARPVPGPC